MVLKRIICIALSVFSLSSAVANAALLSRFGGQAIYDTELDVTWVGDANLAATNAFGVVGIPANGAMNTTLAGEWINGMNAAAYLGFNDWTLPRAQAVNGVSYDFAPTYDGSTDAAFNISALTSAFPGSQASELAYLHYNSLNNSGDVDAAGAAGVCPTGTPSLCLNNTDVFINMQPYYYWTGNTDPADPTLGIFFHFGTGFQASNPVSQEYQVIALRAGDVVAVCEDNIDNDGDGLTDFPDDPGCTNSSDANETDPSEYKVEGIATGGSITFTVAGEVISIITSAGETSATVTANIAAAINENPILSGQAISAVVSGDAIFIDAPATDINITDTGLSFAEPVVSVPAISVQGMTMLVLLIALIGSWFIGFRKRVNS